MEIAGHVHKLQSEGIVILAKTPDFVAVFGFDKNRVRFSPLTLVGAEDGFA
jgi:hypothetical protein